MLGLKVVMVLQAALHSYSKQLGMNKKKLEGRFQNSRSYQNVLTQTIGPKAWLWYEAELGGMYSHCLHAFR